MRFVSFRKDSRESFGLANGSGIVDLASLLPEFADLKALIAAQALDRAAAFAERSADYTLVEVQLLPVIPNPGKIICVGGNFAEHLRESGRQLPDYPMLFARFAESLVGAGQPLLVPPESEQLDFECELAVIVGHPGRRIPRDEAFAHVAGFSCFNDASVRDWQRHTSQFLPGKNFSGTGALGPWMVTRDAMAALPEQTMVTRLDGIEMQRARFDDMIFDVPYLVSYCSAFTPLKPGDLIITGTPHGVGSFREPPLWMRPGSTVEVEISGIGVLSNPISAESPHYDLSPSGVEK